ncbi:MAG TPA: hypothetical protein VFC48_04750 [Cellulomonas sp.]|nr:hypothetical protein [Cellulomonas sp.]
MTDDQAAAPGAALPVDVADDVADDARFDLLAAPLAGPVPAPHVGTHVVATSPEPADEDEGDEDAPAAVGSGAEEDSADDVSEPRGDAELPAPEQLEPEPPEPEPLELVRSPDQDALTPQDTAAEAGSTGDQGAATERDAHAAEPADNLGPDETAVLGAVGTTLPMWLPASAPTSTTLSIAPVPYDLSTASMPRHRRQPWALLVLSILLALTLGLATYLLLTTRAYERRSAEWEAAARTTGTELTQTRADLEGTISDLAATRDQLTTAQARITQLADEKAQLGDDRAIQRQLVDYQQRISAAAGNVATALSTCIDGQYKLIGYLENPSAYDQTDLARFRTDVQTVCGAATDANAALQRELKK